ncbi:MAG TPA: O-acetyl-ADP-ribose deacetylase [Rugosimonospora sp.]|nr:O-acetyl-ADP-ribose deacetylase [Rugosimonospora sp.]
MEITLAEGDITRQQVDVIVNAANSSLLGGGGVDGAIHRRGGPAILAECRKLRDSAYKRGLPIGEAVATTGGSLPARWVIHTVGPVFAKREDRSPLLRCCYTTALGLAESLGAGTIAFPLISAGIYGWPVGDAVKQALTALHDATSKLAEARLVLFGEETFELATHVRADLGI